jgi:hypothetical protein
VALPGRSDDICAKANLSLEHAMPHHSLAQTLPLLASPLFSWRRHPARAIALFRAGWEASQARRTRRRQRQELIDYLATDHRLASDIGYPHRLK